MQKKFYAIGIENPKHSDNIDGLLRSAFLLGASYVFTIGGTKYKRSKINTGKFHELIPLFQFEDTDQFIKTIPENASLVSIDINKTSNKTPIEIRNYKHKPIEIFVLGNETSGLSQEILDISEDIVYINVRNNISLNVAVTGAIICQNRKQLL